MPDIATYTGKDIQVLKGLEPVRKRPAVYIGRTGKPGPRACACARGTKGDGCRRGSTRATVGFFTNFGKVYIVRIDELPSTIGYGDHIQKMFNFSKTTL